MNGNKIYPSRPICCFIKLNINSIIISKTDWNDLGINENSLLIEAINLNKIIKIISGNNVLKKVQLCLSKNGQDKYVCIASNCSNGENITI